MDLQESYPASQVEPGWQICINDQWLVVGIVVETETLDGTRYITIVFEDSKNPSVKLAATAMIPARPPDQLPAVEPEY